jgi:rhodanese-related sulfurtransferase
MDASGSETIGAEEAREAIATSRAQAIDIRDKDAWLDGHIPGSRHAAGDQFEAAIGELAEGRLVVVVGQDVDQCADALSALRDRGFEASALEGGMEAWTDEEFKLQPSDDPELSRD